MKSNSGVFMPDFQSNTLFPCSTIVPLVLPTQEPSDESDEESDRDSLSTKLEGRVKRNMNPSSNGGEVKDNIPILRTLPTILEENLVNTHQGLVITSNEKKESKVITKQVKTLVVDKKDAVRGAAKFLKLFVELCSPFDTCCFVIPLISIRNQN